MEEKKIYTHKFAFVDKIGLELEGGWEEEPSGYHIAGDASVRCNGNILGEVRTDPKSVLKEVFNEINTKYPDDIDQSCGMHIHVSTKKGVFFLLATDEFKDYFLRRMGVFAKYLRHSGNETDYKRFLARLNNSNRYCKRDFLPVEQLRHVDSRRTMLNFSAYREHGTVECRLMPMFEKISNARMATYEVADTFEQFLEHNQHKLTEVEVDVTLNSEELMPESSSLEVVCV